MTLTEQGCTVMPNPNFDSFDRSTHLWPSFSVSHERTKKTSTPFGERGNLPSLLRTIVLCSMLTVVGCGSSAPVATTDVQQEEPSTDVLTAHVESSEQESGRSSHRGEIELASATTTSAPSMVDNRNQADKGSPDWLLQEIARLRTAPVETLREPVAGMPGQFKEVQLSAVQIEQEKIRRYKQTVQLASQVIGKTHRDPNSEEFFNSAVHYLTDARMQLALAGEDEQAQLLLEDAQSLFQRDATSFAAMEAASRVLELTQAKASRSDNTDPKWTLAFARQARMFAANFPQETHRSAVNVLAAGRMCERLGVLTEAETCLAWIEQGFPQTPYAEQAAGPLRRLRLVGNPLTEFGGPTLDGRFLSINQLRGKSLLVVFWTSNSAQFREDLPVIQKTLNNFPDRIAAVGVNLDTDEIAATNFVKQSQLSWPHIFHSDPQNRGEYNVVARHYGVVDVPQYWLVDSQGIVRSVDLSIDELARAVSNSPAQ